MKNSSIYKWDLPLTVLDRFFDSGFNDLPECQAKHNRLKATSLVVDFVFMKKMKTMLLQLTSRESKARHRLQSGRNRYIVQSDKKDEK